MGAAAPLRQPIPLARSILWSPTSAGARGGRPGNIVFPVFIAQSALQAIHEHLAAPPKPGQGLLGFLVGDFCECPETNVSYLVIDSALRLNQPIYGDRTMDVVTRIWDRIEAQAAEQQGHLIGWYHTHPPLPLTLSEHDLETHEHYFAEPWQVALIVGTSVDGTEPAAGMFRAGSDVAWPTTPLPFYELLGEESIRPGGKKRSYVTWRNYRAYNPLADRAPRAGPKTEPPEAAAPAMPPPQPAPEPPPPRTASLPLTPPKPPVPAKSDELVFLTSAEDFASPPRPAPPRTPPSEPPRALARRAAPPAAPKPPPPRAAPAAPAPLPEEPPEAFDEEPVDEPVAEEPPRPVRAPPVRRRARKRRRGVWVAAIGLLLVGAGAGLYLQFKPSLPSLPKLPKLPSLPWPKRQATAPAPASRPPTTASQRQSATPRQAQPRPQPQAPPRPAAPVARLDQVGESLAQAVRSFGEHAALFDRRQLGCDGLGRGLLAVEDRWAVYSTARRASGVLDPRHTVRDQMLYAGVDSVERRFERSGCPRP